MSRIGAKPVNVPEGCSVSVDGSRVFVKGPKGELSMSLPPGMGARVSGGVVEVVRPDDSIRSRSLHGLARTLVANMVGGVCKGYAKELELEGVGFKAEVQGKKLVLSLGFSAPVRYAVPDGVNAVVKGNLITVSGADKQEVGCAAARIRSFYPAEPYKGKGIRYKGEHVKRKAGKTVA